MKKVLFSLFVIAGLASCGSGASSEAVAVDSTKVDSVAVVVDSTKVDSSVVAPAAEVKAEDVK